jgi:DNA mismatch repair protein MutS
MEIRDGAITRLEDWVFAHDYGQRMLTEQFSVAGLEGFGLADHQAAATAAGAIVHYLRETSVMGNGTKSAGHALQHLNSIRLYQQQAIRRPCSRRWTRP